jgi:hypothetical protein
MKKIVIVSLLALASSSVLAAVACDAQSPPVGTTVPGSPTNFVRADFKPQCSANTHVVYTDDAAAQKLYGGSASVKGKSYYGGSTNGGAIQKVGDCTGGSCGSNAAASAALGSEAAVNYGSSS